MMNDVSLSSAKYLRARLSRLGGTLTLQGTKLRLALPAGRLTPDLRRALDTHRDALIALLADTPEPAAVAKAPLSPFQHSFWTMHLREDADLATLHASLILPIRGDIDAVRLAQAVRRLAGHHTGLRLRVTTGPAGQPVQTAGDGPELQLALDDADASARIAAQTQTRFDLGAEPPLRLMLLQGRDRHRLVLVGHHVALDGWSIGLVLRDLFALYCGQSLSPTPDPLALSAQLARDAAQPHMQARIQDAARALHGLPLCQPLPTDQARDPYAIAQGREIGFDLPAATAAALAAIARQAGGGIYSALLAGFGLMWSGLTGCPRLPVMSPVANRTSAGVEGAVTCLANGVILAALLPATLPCRTAVGRVAAAMSQALDRQDLPYDMLVDALNQPRLPGIFPGAQVYFALQDAATLPVVPGLQLGPAELPSSLSRQDLLIEFRHAPDGGLSCRINHDARLFEGVTIAALAQRLQAALTSMAQAPDQPLHLPEQARQIPVTSTTATLSLPDGTPLGMLTRAHGNYMALTASDPNLSLRDSRGDPTPAGLPGLLYRGDTCLDLTARLNPQRGLELLADFSASAAGWVKGRVIRLNPMAARVLATGLVADAALSLCRIAGDWRPVLWVVPQDSSPQADLRDRVSAALPDLPRDMLVCRLASLPRDRDGGLDRHWLATLPVNDPALFDADVSTQPNPTDAQTTHVTALLPPVASGCSSFPDFLPSGTAGLEAAASGTPALHHGAPLRLDYPAQGWSPCEWLAHDATLHAVEQDGEASAHPMSQVLDRALRMAGGLHAAGLRPGDSVIIAPRRVEHYLTAFLAASAAGLRVALMAPTSRFSTAGLTHICNIAQTRSVIADAETLGHDLPPRFAFLSCRDLLAHPPLTAPHRWGASDQVLLGFTSGSTGLPKGVPLTAMNIWSMPQAFGPAFGMGPDSHALCFTGLDHVASLIGFSGSALAAGASLTLFATPRFIADPETLPRCMADRSITHSWAPDFAWKLLATTMQAMPVLDLSALSQVFSGGECPLRATFDRLGAAFARHGARPALRTAWGMAETTSIFTLSAPLAGESHVANAGVLDSGMALPGQSVRIVGAGGVVLGDGQIGLLQVRGPSVFREYILADAEGVLLRQSPLTDEGWLETGDLALLSQGRLMLLGREKDVIVLNGRNISQAAIEDSIDDLPGIRAGFSAAIALREGRRGRQMLVVFFVPQGSADDATLSRLVEKVAQTIAVQHGTRPDFTLPVAADTIPKTNLGKIQRERLRRAFHSGTYEGTAARIDALRGTGRQIADRLWRWQPQGVTPLPCPPVATIIGGPARLRDILPHGQSGGLLVDATAMAFSALPDSAAIAAEAARRRDLMLAHGAGRIVWLEHPAFAATGQALAAMAGQELADLRCTSVVIAPEALEALPQLLAHHLPGLHVAPQGRASGRKLAQVPPLAPDAWRELPTDVTVLVPGGLGKVGRLVLPVLLDWTGWRLVLIGRRAADDLAPLQAGLTDPQRVAYVQADATDATAMARIARDHGAVAALNLAGTLDQTDFASAATETLALMVRARLGVAQALDAALAGQAGGVVVHVTSTYALLGRRGHLGYALAHGAQGDWIAARGDAPDAPRHVELSCGQWQDPDAAACDARTNLAARQGFGLIDAQAGAAAIIRAMLGPDAALVLGLDPEGTETRALITQPPRALDILAQDHPTPMAHALARDARTHLHRRSHASTPRMSELEAGIMALWQRVLGSGRAFDADVNFFDVGGSSLLVARLHHQMTEAYGRPGTLVSLFSHTTIRAQAALLSDDKPDETQTSPARTIRSAASTSRRQRAIRTPES